MGFEPHHIGIGPDEVRGNGSRGRVFLLPGSPRRAAELAGYLTGASRVDNPRQFTVWLGALEQGGRVVDVGILPTGIGCPSVNVVVTELIAVGARRLLRVGTAGTLQDDVVRHGDLVIATAAVRDEAASDAYAPRDVPAMAHPDWTTSLVRAARHLGLADRTFAGVVHTKDSFYGRQFPVGPLADDHRRYMQMLVQMGVLATEMETAHLLVLAAWYGHNAAPVSGRSEPDGAVKAGSVVGILGSLRGLAPAEVARLAEERVCAVAARAAVELIGLEDQRVG